MEEDKYVLGFNHAYILMGKQPEVLGFLNDIKSKSEYIKGLKDGRYQFSVDFVNTNLEKIPKQE